MDTVGPEEQRDDDDDSQIEIADLQPRVARQNTHVPWHQRRVELSRPVVAAGVVALIVLALLVVLPIGDELAALIARPTPTATVAQLSFPTAVPATPTPTPYPTPTLAAVPAIGLTPRTCPPGPTLIPFDPAAITAGVGGQDVWVVGPFIVPGNSISIGSQRPTDYTLYGWPVELQVLINPSLTGLVTLTGSDLRTHYPLWIAGEIPSQPVTQLMTIDPTQDTGATSDGKWKIWFGIMYLPSAGCYALQASWPGGGWRVTFAAGR